MTKRVKQPRRSGTALGRPRGEGDVGISGWAMPRLQDAMDSYRTMVETSAERNLQALDDTIWVMVREAIDEAVEYALAEEGGLWFGFVFEDDESPLTASVEIPFGDAEGEGPHFAFDMAAGLDVRIAECRRDGSHADGLALAAKELRRLADDIDAAREESRRKGMSA